MKEEKSVIATHESINELTHKQSVSFVNAYIKAATSENTRKAYRSDIAHYERWGGKLPALFEIIIRYLEAYANKLNPRTLSRRLIALRHWHIYQGFLDPTLHPAVMKTIAGITRVHGKPKTKARPITPDEITRIAFYLHGKSNLTALRDSALILIGFFGALRRSELTAIECENINWQDKGIEILLPGSKTDQTHEGQYCVIPWGNEQICPIKALKKWLEHSQIQHGPIFRSVSLKEKIATTALTPLAVNHILKACAKAAGIPAADKFSSHSLRRGLATSAARTGTPLQAIMRAGRWKQTNTVMEYIEANERFTENAALNVLNSLKRKSK